MSLFTCSECGKHIIEPDPDDPYLCADCAEASHLRTVDSEYERLCDMYDKGYLDDDYQNGRM